MKIGQVFSSLCFKTFEDGLPSQPIPLCDSFIRKPQIPSLQLPLAPGSALWGQKEQLQALFHMIALHILEQLL